MKFALDKLQFKFLLYALYLLIRVTALRSRQFREKLLERDVTVVMGSKDGTVARTIRCKGGKVRSKRRRQEDVVALITWASPKAGSRVMLKVAQGNPKALVKAVIAGDLLPGGDAGGVRWFLDVVGMLARIYVKKRS